MYWIWKYFKFCWHLFVGNLELFLKGQEQTVNEDSEQLYDPNQVIENVDGEDGPLNGKFV